MATGGGKAGAVNDQGSGLLEREEVEVTLKKNPSHLHFIEAHGSR